MANKGRVPLVVQPRSRCEIKHAIGGVHDGFEAPGLVREKNTVRRSFGSGREGSKFNRSLIVQAGGGTDAQKCSTTWRRSDIRHNHRSYGLCDMRIAI